MSLGNGIILNGTEPKGRFQECIVSGTPKPGTCMTKVAATEPVNGIFTYEAFNRGADGADAPTAVLLPDYLQGKLATDAYTNGDRGFLYFPLPGDELNMLLKNISGTSDAFAIGDPLMVDEDTGKLIAKTGTPEKVAFECAETVVAITEDTLARCVCNG